MTRPIFVGFKVTCGSGSFSHFPCILLVLYLDVIFVQLHPALVLSTS